MNIVKIHVEPGKDYGNATDIGVSHDIGDPGLLCRAHVRIYSESSPDEVATQLDRLAQAVRQFDAAREDVKRERENVVTIPLSALDQIAERANAAGMVPMDADNPEHVAALVGLATKVQAASDTTHPDAKITTQA